MSDDILLDLGTSPLPILFEARLVVPRRYFKNIETTAKQIIPIDATVTDSEK